VLPPAGGFAFGEATTVLVDHDGDATVERVERE